MEENIIEKILQKYETPVYVFDINKAKKRIEYLKNKLPSDVLMCYAIKANTFIVKDIEKYIDRFEVCSPGEYEICKNKNIDLSKILLSGVYKTPEIIEKMILNNEPIKCYTVESLKQFELLKRLSQANKIKIMIRITSGNQFGINDYEAEEIVKNRSQYENIEIIGIQYFSGTQKKSLKILKRELDYIDEFVVKLQEQYDFITQELEFGPGLPVFYFQNDEFDEDSYMDEFYKILKQIKFKGKLILELGRSIAASCGNYITKVVDKKINKKQNYAILDGGIHHLVYYGQSMAMKIPKCEIYPPRQSIDDSDERWNLCGSLCTINDILVKQFPVNNLKIGDVFIFENTGAYCMTEGISLFLSRDLPKVIKIKEDSNLELVRDNLPTYKFNM